jgi:transcriptional regulator of acetoin/glycerol metabolism
MDTRNHDDQPHPDQGKQDEPAAHITERVRALWPEPADEPLRRAALTAATHFSDGTLTIEDIGAQLAQARHAEAEARAAARMVGILAVENGATKSGTAAKLGIDRMALLTWLGLR